MKLSRMGLVIGLLLFINQGYAQQGRVYGTVRNASGQIMEAATVSIPALQKQIKTDKNGDFNISEIPYGDWDLKASFIGYDSFDTTIHVDTMAFEVHITLNVASEGQLADVVVSGTMKEVSKRDSPVPVEVYTSKFFKANPTPSVFDALQQINGVRPQLNCNVCSTGDIHINGLEGPYTMVLIDGMPVVSGLSTAYGLSGIPQSLIDRVEVVKGPASTLYGSEAVGGLINIITKRPASVPDLSADVFASSWQEMHVDLAGKFRTGKDVHSFLGVNYFNYQNPVDNNQDGFTDMTLQHRISVFNKWEFDRSDNRVFSLAGRYVYEDRWGGQTHWNTAFRGGDEVYGESIYTKRWELFGTYQLPLKEHITFQFSANGHRQDAAYADELYQADQYIGFGQFTWMKTMGKHDLLSGLAYRYTYFDDNTPATADPGDVELNHPAKTHFPGVFVQDEIALKDNHKLLLGMRYDYNSIHGSIFTPRLNYKWNSENQNNILRLSLGNGYRVAHVFTEDHAALTGARDLVFINDLKPEKSWNANINFVKRLQLGSTFMVLDGSVFTTYFTNKIIPDYETDPNKIIFDNLNGHSISKGISLNLDIRFLNGLTVLAGGTFMDVYSVEDEVRTRQLFAERFTGTWSLGYAFQPIGLRIDYTGNVYGPMRLPLLSDTDPRREFSPWWSIQNLQLTQSLGTNMELYGGVKNLLNWTVNKGNPFIIARAHDPFDREVVFDDQGRARVTPENPYGLTFDPDSYAYGPNQGIRGFLGVRYNLFRRTK